MQTITDALAAIRIGKSVSYRNLTIFPLFGSDKSADYLTLDEALEQKSSMITEISEGGSVPELKFVNSASSRVFLLDGEELIGAKQNRIVNISILVPAGQTLIIPVSCVEAGRWSHRSQQFAAAPRAHYARGRAMKMAQVSASMRATGQRRSDQSEVWRDISEVSEHFGVASATSAMSDVYEQESVRLESYEGSLPAVERQSGAIFAIGGRIIGLDLFDSQETFRKLYPKLLRSYGLDALGRFGQKTHAEAVRCTPAKANAFLSRILKAKVEEFSAVGEGIDLRLSGRSVTGAALVSAGRVIHLSAFTAA